MQDYVDAQAGGPGKGFFQIVRNPFQARRVINEGKMAVVLEVEVSELFGCSGARPVELQTAGRRRRPRRPLQAGVRSSLLLNKFDNPLTGVRFDSGPIGVLINAANRDSYGSFWSAETCKGARAGQPDRERRARRSSALTPAGPLGVAPGAAPAYPPAPHCNTRGLTDLGAHTVSEMMDMGMIVNPDHMSQKAVDETLSIAEARHYSGVISPHSWMDPRNWPRIWKLGGMAFPGAGPARRASSTRGSTYRPERTPYFFGWGYGADLGGLAKQGAPPGGGPTRDHLSVQVARRRDHGRPAADGRPHLRLLQGGRRPIRPLRRLVRQVGKPAARRSPRTCCRGPEAYLEMWERAVGVPASRCKAAARHLTRNGSAACVSGSTRASCCARRPAAPPQARVELLRERQGQPGA